MIMLCFCCCIGHNTTLQRVRLYGPKPNHCRGNDPLMIAKQYCDNSWVRAKKKNESSVFAKWVYHIVVINFRSKFEDFLTESSAPVRIIRVSPRAFFSQQVIIIYYNTIYLKLVIVLIRGILKSKNIIYS